jgi:hypothetical protein
MTYLAPKNIRIPFEVYQRLLNHLELHAPTDAWAAQLLAELQKEARDASVFPSGTRVLDGGEVGTMGRWN